MSKILVCDDDQRHLDAAVEQLSRGHELTCVDSYEEAIGLLKPSTNIEVLLSDLLMPAEPYALGPQGMKFLGTSIPIGLILALRAAKVGVPLIAVVTDANHHNHPMSAAVDWLNPAYWNDKVTGLLHIEGSRVLIAHALLLADGRKDWAKALSVLQSDCC